MQKEGAVDSTHGPAFDEEKTHLDEVLEKIDAQVAYLNAEADRKTNEANEMYALDNADREAKRSLHHEAHRHRAHADEFLLKRDEPYFRRIDTLSTDADGAVTREILYVGSDDVRIDGETIVFRVWNERVASLINNVQAHIGDEDVQVLLNRKLEIKKSELLGYHDDYVADADTKLEDGVFDPYLLEILADSRRRHAPADIIRSIQKAQMDIVRFPMERSFIVQGCAGSGKTMILLHRLSYLVYNNREYDWKRTMVLSANPAFNEYMADLCRTLEIEQIPRSTYEEYIATLIGRYSGRQFDLTRLLSEEALSSDFLKAVYSSEFADRLRDRATQWWSSNVSKLTESGLMELAERRGIEVQTTATRFGVQTMEGWNKVYLAVRREFSAIEQRMQTASKELDRAEKALEWGERKRARMDQGVGQSKEAAIEWLIDMAEDINEAIETYYAAAASDGAHPGNTGDVYSREKIGVALEKGALLPDETLQTLIHIPGADCLLDYNHDLSEQAEQDERLRQQRKEIATLKRRTENIAAELPTDEERKTLDEAANIIGQLTENAIISGPVADTLAEARKQSGASADGYKRSGLYRHQLYLRLLVCTWYYRSLSAANRETSFYIDEAQDYAPTELQLLRKVNGTSATFDIFGDLLQRTNAGRGIDEWADLQFLTSSVTELNQNYRNTAQIAEFCNAETGSAVEPIGIEGDDVAIFASTADGVAWIVEQQKKDKDARAAVIVPSLSDEMHELLLDAIERGELLWPTEKDALAEAKTGVPVLSVEQSKGREYEYVYAVVDPANTHASYIAYTRAIQALGVTQLRPADAKTDVLRQGEQTEGHLVQVPSSEPASVATSVEEQQKTAEAVPEEPAARAEERARMLTGREYLLNEVFSDEFRFQIPNYQRPYAWGRDEAKQLLDDLISALDNESSEYFLGSVVLIRDGDNPKSDVIDGQQRLTTLSILASAIADRATGALRDRALALLSSRGDEGLQPRIQLRDRDNPFYREVIATGNFGKLKKQNPNVLPEAQANLANVGRFFSKELESMSEQEIDTLLSFILEKCSIIVVMTPDYRSAFRIFSVLNNRGMDLQSSDILKAQTIGRLPEEDQDKYADRWEAMEAELGRDLFDRFFEYMLQSIPGAAYNKNASEYILDQVLSGPKALSAKSFMDNLVLPKYEAFQTLVAANYVDPRYGDAINRQLWWLNNLPNQDWVPPAIVWMERYGNQPMSTAKFFRKLERLATYMALDTSHFPRSKRIQRYKAISEQLMRSAEPPALQLSAGDRVAFMNILKGDVNKQISSRMTKHLLLHLEEQLCESRGETFSPPPTFAVEPVLPEVLAADSRWARDWTRKDHAAWVNRLVNLMPLAKRIPATQRNAEFTVKKIRYFNSANSAGFSLPSTLSDYREWVPEVLEVRQKELTDLLLEYWRLNGQQPAPRRRR